MVWIAGTTVTTAQQISFTSIPQTFTHLQIRCSIRGTSTNAVEEILLTLNGDNNAGSYGYAHRLRGDGATVTSGSVSNVATFQYQGFISSNGAAANIFGSTIIDVLDYTNTNKNKTVCGICGFDANGSGRVGVYSGAWYNTAAINSFGIAITGSPFNVAVGSRIDLYGITSSEVTGA
jgi:hypothetical protein